jgi:hypothetical protein
MSVLKAILDMTEDLVVFFHEVITDYKSDLGGSCILYSSSLFILFSHTLVAEPLFILNLNLFIFT